MDEINVMQQDDRGYLWLTVSEVVPYVESASMKGRIRKIERWCADGVLAPYTHTASRQQIIELIVANRIRGFPHEKKGLYLIHRDGLARIEESPPQRGRPKKGKQTGAGTVER